MLSQEEIQFYTRQLGIASWGTSAQEKLKQSKVFVAGAGGLGSAAIYYIAAAGVGNITICDSDVVEISNLNRQILHRHAKIGERKVDSARSAALGLNPFLNIMPVMARIDKNNAEELIRGSDLILDCLDNFETRFILNRSAVKMNIPMVHAGVSEFQGQITFLHPPETPCLECFISSDIKKKNSNIAGMTAGIIGSMQALEAVKYLGGIAPSLKNRLLFWDGVSMRLEGITLKRNSGCTVCKKIQGETNVKN
jgi:adenylyltransferase/sulfurtransferase